MPCQASGPTHQLPCLELQHVLFLVVSTIKHHRTLLQSNASEGGAPLVEIGSLSDEDVRLESSDPICHSSLLIRLERIGDHGSSEDR